MQFKRVVIYLLLIFIYQNGSSQAVSEQIIRLDIKDETLDEVFRQITAQSNLSFSFNSKKIDLNERIEFSINSTLVECLNELGRLSGLRYSLVEKQIVVKPPKSQQVIVEDGPITISGYVRDAATGEALIGATILVDSLFKGTVTNSYGFYSLTLPRSKYDFIGSFVGYEDQIKSITLAGNIVSSFTLTEKPPILNEVLVVADAPTAVEEIQLSKTNLRPSTVADMPAVFGEMDVIKSLAYIPGIKLYADGSTFFYVRGGDRDQNLILQDEAPIYNPTHLLGLFSTIIPDATNSIEVYKGEMPANYGGKLSSVIDIHTKKGNNQNFELWGNVGLVSTKIGIEGPFKKGKHSYLLAGRLSRIQWFFKNVNPNLEKLQFSDLTGKVNFKLNDNNSLYASFYLGGDQFFQNNSGISWTNQAGTISWNHIVNDKMFANTTFSGSNYEYIFYTNVAGNDFWRSRIGNASLKTDFSYFIKPDNVVTFGLGIIGQNFNPGNLESGSGNQAPPVSTKNALEFYLYANQETKLTERLGVNYGLRFNTFSNQGEAFEFIYNEQHQPVQMLTFEEGEFYNTYVNLEPRITLSYMFNPNNSLKASYGRNVQNIHLITNSISPFNSIEVWLPSSLTIKPQVANQATLGYFLFWPNIGTSFTTEVYYKKMSNQIDYEDHANLLLNPFLEGELRFGIAKAYGIEATVKKETGRLQGWLGYSYARVRRYFDEINDGKVYNAFNDRPNEVNLVVNYDISLRWKLGLNWIYTTGAPFSSPTSFFNFDGQEVPYYSQKNNDRFPDYHRLDASATFKLNKNFEKRYQHSLTFSVYNLYGRKNPVFINFNKVETGNNEFKTRGNLLVRNSTSSAFYLIQFMPSVSYNFKFK